MNPHTLLRRLGTATGGIGRPVDYSERVRYRRPPALYRRISNSLGVLLVSHGLASPGYAVVLEVRGRRSGRLRRNVLVETTIEGEHYLVSLAGESDWVRNVRAAGGQAILRHGSARSVELVEVPSEQRPAIIGAYLQRGGRLVDPSREGRFYFGLGPDPSREEIGAVAGYYPVFRIARSQPS